VAGEAEPVRVRPARAADSEAIVRTLREGFDPLILPYTIVSAAGVERFVYDTLAQGGERSGTVFTVAARGDEAAGVTEFRRSVDELFLNHIYVRKDARGTGLGRQLLRESILVARDHGQREIALDVFAGNERARRWYESLGFRERSVAHWVEARLPRGGGPGLGRGHLDGLPAARLSMDRYGFSSFQLTTAAGSYRVGRIGPGLFRVTAGGVLGDGDALSILAEMEPRAALLCISPEPGVHAHPSLAARVVGTSHRLAAGVDGALEALA
jgi:ribosomal protein S18 acetylase RimI-like enzyme